jgi:dolichyl-phosphate beta-glucosyltransferase
MPAIADPPVSLVVPAYNEASRLPHSLAELSGYCAAGGEGESYEVLIVVEHSTDGTLELARESVAEQANFRVIDNRVQRGKGYAVRSGMLEARGDIVFYMDADLSVPLEDIDRFLAHFAANPGTDVLLGSRQHAESRVERRQSLLRQTMGRTFNRILRWLSLIPFRDTQCGFKAFRHDAAREIFGLQEIDGFAFDVEVILLAQALGYHVDELPVRWLNSPESKVHIVRDSLRMLLDAFTVRRRVGRVMRARKAEQPVS